MSVTKKTKKMSSTLQFAASSALRLVRGHAAKVLPRSCKHDAGFARFEMFPLPCAVQELLTICADPQRSIYQLVKDRDPGRFSKGVWEI